MQCHNETKISPSIQNTKLVAFVGHRVDTCGKPTMLCQYNGKKYKVEFKILEQDVPSVLGLPTAIELNLIVVDYVIIITM